jgi:hypothetical protein
MAEASTSRNYGIGFRAYERGDGGSFDESLRARFGLESAASGSTLADLAPLRGLRDFFDGTGIRLGRVPSK